MHATTQPRRHQARHTDDLRTVDARLRRALHECFDLGATVLTDDMPMQILGNNLVSLAQIEAVVETEFGVRIPDFALANMGRFGDLVRTVRVCVWARGGDRRPSAYKRAA